MDSDIGAAGEMARAQEHRCCSGKSKLWNICPQDLATRLNWFVNQVLFTQNESSWTTSRNFHIKMLLMLIWVMRINCAKQHVHYCDNKDMEGLQQRVTLPPLLSSAPGRTSFVTTSPARVAIFCLPWQPVVTISDSWVSLIFFWIPASGYKVWVLGAKLNFPIVIVNTPTRPGSQPVLGFLASRLPGKKDVLVLVQQVVQSFSTCHFRIKWRDRICVQHFSAARLNQVVRGVRTMFGERGKCLRDATCSAR